MRFKSIILGLAAAALEVSGAGIDAASAPAGAGVQLPRIRVAKDGRTFATEEGKPFVPFGVNYFRPGTGWAPQLWKQFDAEAAQQDFARMKALGVNCVRVFLTFGSFYTNAGELRAEGLVKFDRFLELAERAGIYVHPTGPDFWEGFPNWRPVAVEDEPTLRALESFWKLFAARYRGRGVIFAYDLRNEPEVGWNNEVLTPRWNKWLQKKYGAVEKLIAAWGTTNRLRFSAIPPPAPKDRPGNAELLEFQSFREEVADEWTRRQVAGIKSVDPEALTTVGCVQWSVPSLLLGSVRGYAAFRPERQAKFLDFLAIHFYPSERGGYEYRSEEDELANLAYLEGIVREVARAGKPVVLSEFGWYGGATRPKFDQGKHPLATEAQQARYCQRVIETSAGFAVGWLNWGLYDYPQASDCSELTGLLTVEGKTKVWGATFRELAARFAGKEIAPATIGPRPELNWAACVTTPRAGIQFREEYLQAFMQDRQARKDGAK
jgi:hypothetical protein